MDQEDKDRNLKEPSFLEQFLAADRKERFKKALVQRTCSLTVVLDRVHNSHNISAVIRSADAFGLRDVHLVGESFEYSRGIALGTERWIQLIRHQSAEEAIGKLKDSGFKIAITAPEDGQFEAGAEIPRCPVFKLPFQEKIALVFGNEKLGVSQAFLSAADFHVFIPMFGFVESLNISVACAICLFCSSVKFSEEYHSTGDNLRQTPTLNEQEQDELYQLWLGKSVRNADLILREVERRKIFEA